MAEVVFRFIQPVLFQQHAAEGNVQAAQRRQGALGIGQEGRDVRLSLAAELRRAAQLPLAVAEARQVERRLDNPEIQALGQGDLPGRFEGFAGGRVHREGPCRHSPWSAAR